MGIQNYQGVIMKHEGPFVFRPVEAWDVDFVLRDGFRNPGGNVLFIERSDAIKHGIDICRINLPESKFTYMEGSEVKSVPLMEEYDHFYLAKIAIDMITNDDLQLLIEEDLPALWFTKMKINPSAIMEMQRVPI